MNLRNGKYSMVCKRSAFFTWTVLSKNSLPETFKMNCRSKIPVTIVKSSRIDKGETSNNSFASAIFKEGKDACGVDAKSWLLPFKTKTPSPRVDDLKVFVGSKEESTVFTENFVDSDTVNCPKTRLGKKQKARQKPLQALDKFEELEIISIRVNCKVVPLKRYLICNASKKLKIKNIC